MPVVRLACLVLAAFWALVVPSLHGHPPSGGPHGVVGDEAGHHGDGVEAALTGPDDHGDIGAVGLQVGRHPHQGHDDLPLLWLTMPFALLAVLWGALVTPSATPATTDARPQGPVRTRGSPVARHELARV